MVDPSITLSFLGSDDLKPNALPASELAKLINAFEDAVGLQVVSDQPEIKQQQIYVSLVDIQSNSIDLCLLPNLPLLTFPAAQKLVTALQSGDFKNVAFAALRAFSPILKFVRKHDCTANLKIEYAQQQTEATITKATNIEVAYSISGQTELYGEVKRSGGVEPKVQLQTTDGQTLYCDTTESIAKKLGARLYEKVKVAGLATWDVKTFKIIDFEIDRVVEDYNPLPADQAFAELRNRYGYHFDAIPNMNHFLTTVREGEEVETHEAHLS